LTWWTDPAGHRCQSMQDQNNHTRKTEKSVLIIGGGISGITAAVEAAETGCRVYLLEKLPYLGGQVARMNEYFPKLCPPYCGLEINFRRIRDSSRIEVITSATAEKISGTAGDFRVSLRCEPEYVSSACTACGECTVVCPVESPDPFNYGLTVHKAIDLPHELSYPDRYYLDDTACLKDSCMKCVPACRYGAINLGAESSTRELNVGTVLFCTGWSPYNPEKLAEYSWGKSPDILSNVMMERLGAPNGPTGGLILRQSDGEPARRIAFIQCAGSRDENHLPYCSAVCCSASLKQALYFTEQDPQNQADIYYIDLRVSGRNEDFLRKVENHERICLIKGKVSGINLEADKSTREGENPGKDTGRPVLEAEDILSGRKIRNSYDMVILATGIVPVAPALAGMELDRDGFIIREALEEGYAAGGCCADPKDVAASVREATGLVINVLQ
jgi:quinone-modifying oxidoreductase subunit QmoA